MDWSLVFTALRILLVLLQIAVATWQLWQIVGRLKNRTPSAASRDYKSEEEKGKASSD